MAMHYYRTWINQLRLYHVVAPVLVGVLLHSCATGREAYNRGDYYTATIQAIERIRAKPNHKKAIEILRMSYPLAIANLEGEVDNKMQSNDESKYRIAFKNYTAINRLYEEVKRSPVALHIISDPVNKYEEMARIKEQAVEETYNAGIQELLKDTREGAKQAYYLFKEVNRLSPDYKESVEMGKQAKLNATIYVLVQAVNSDYQYDWNFESAIFGTRVSEFIKFYSPRYVETNSIERIDQSIQVISSDFNKGRPSVSQTVTRFSDSVKVGDVQVNGKSIPQYEEVTATLFSFTKRINAGGSVSYRIIDEMNSTEILDRTIRANDTWSETWGICKGDTRALSKIAKKVCKASETDMPRNYLYREVKIRLDEKLKDELYDFYRRY